MISLIKGNKKNKDKKNIKLIKAEFEEEMTRQKNFILGLPEYASKHRYSEEDRYLPKGFFAREDEICLDVILPDLTTEIGKHFSSIASLRDNSSFPATLVTDLYNKVIKFDIDYKTVYETINIAMDSIYDGEYKPFFNGYNTFREIQLEGRPAELAGIWFENFVTYGNKCNEKAFLLKAELMKKELVAKENFPLLSDLQRTVIDKLYTK